MTTELIKKTETRIGITKEYATYLLKTCWPGAPDDSVIKAALICSRYGLDPLLKEVVLVKFASKNGDDWVPILGIKATRKIASRNHRYSYIDGPRVMTEDEQKTIFGEIDPNRIWAITKIQYKGNVYPGYGSWTKANTVYGADKGNTQRNMAFIRSERQAIDRMVPGEIPEEIDVTDESFVPLKIDTATLEQGKADARALAEQDVADLYGEPEQSEMGL